MIGETTNYPGWPDIFEDVSYEEWKGGRKDVLPGQGLFGSGIGIWPEKPPHPEYVEEWRQQHNASVAETATNFGLSAVRVLEATGRK